MNIRIVNLCVKYGSKQIIHNVNMDIKQGEVVCLLGPNGSGKTTIFKAVLGLIPIHSGIIELNGLNINKWNRNMYARTIAYVPQIHIPPFPYTVIDVVSSGRLPYVGTFSVPGKKDYYIAESMLEKLSISYLKNQIYTEISGGERQLVLIARALTQEPSFIVMDEPTAHLDYGNQIRTLTRIAELANNNITVILTTHNPEHVFICGTKVAALQNGYMIDKGIPQKVITQSLIKKLYNIDVAVINNRIDVADSYQFENQTVYA